MCPREGVVQAQKVVDVEEGFGCHPLDQASHRPQATPCNSREHAVGPRAARRLHGTMAVFEPEGAAQPMEYREFLELVGESALRRHDAEVDALRPLFAQRTAPIATGRLI